MNVRVRGLWLEKGYAREVRGSQMRCGKSREKGPLKLHLRRERQETQTRSLR